MGLEQLASMGGGRRFKRPYVEEINARTPYLPGIYQQRSENEYRDKMYGLNERQLESQEKIGMENLALEREAQKEAKKRNKTARNLGYANIGMGAGLGVLQNYDSIKSGLSSISSLLDFGSAPDVAGGVINPSAGQDFGGITGFGGVASDGLDWMYGGVQEYVSPILKELGGGVWDAGMGIYDSLLGDAIDIDWADAATEFTGLF